MPKNTERKPYKVKFIQKLPSISNDYVAIIKTDLNLFDSSIGILKTRNLHNYICQHKSLNIIVIQYYIIKDYDPTAFSEFHEQDFYYKNLDIDQIASVLKNKYNVQPIIPISNYKNPCIKCKTHRFTPSNNDEMISHLKECDTYEYTLFGESVPKNLLQGKKKSNVTIINNTNTQNIYNNYVSFRQTGDFIRSKLSVEQKREILNSIDKVGELVKLHFQYDEVKNNIVLKNISPYKSCEIFDGKSFIVVNNHEIFRYYVMDQLDTLDYFAVVDVKDPVLTRRLERYDDHIRKNDKHMLAMINKTMLQVKAEISKIKKK